MTPAAAFIRHLADDQELVFAFLVVFSRFECALKRSGYLKHDDGPAEPNWDTFANTLKGRLGSIAEPKFIEASRFLLAKPPETQVATHRQLGWRKTIRGDGESEERYLLRLVTTVRNNLFHGGKYPYPFGPVVDVSRDRRLLQAGISILEACLALSPEVQALFEEAA